MGSNDDLGSGFTVETNTLVLFRDCHCSCVGGPTFEKAGAGVR